MEPLSAVAQNALREILQKGPMSPGKLGLAWRLAVGPAMDRATQVALRDDGVVEVVAVDAAWRREVKRSQAMIVQRLQALVGPESLTRLRIVARRSDG